MIKSLRSAGAAAMAFSITTGLVATLAEQPAAAQEYTVTAPAQAEVRTRVVSTADLDLTNSRDLRRLDARIRSASRKVCESPSDRGFSLAESLCRQQAIQTAAPQVARLIDRAQRLAAAGLPSRIAATSIAVAARGE